MVSPVYLALRMVPGTSQALKYLLKERMNKDIDFVASWWK